MKKERLLTKSRFKLGHECPAKLFYTSKKDQYADQNLEDSFLLALAEGGFQVGELAKLYFPGGHDIRSLGYEESLKETNELLKLNKVTIYEAAVRSDDLFIRVDILVKNGKKIDLIEVKAKSIDDPDEPEFLNKKGNVAPKWEPYLIDIAFQKHVTSKAFPDYRINGFLMLADKSAKCPTDGLNQKFLIVTDKTGRKSVKVSENITKKDLDPQILSMIDVNDICEIFYSGHYGNNSNLSFENYVTMLSENYKNDKKISAPVTGQCKNCEFQTTEEDEKNGLKSGKKECWKEQLRWKDSDFNDPTILDIWDFRKKDDLIAQGKIKIKDVTIEDISPENDDKPGISRTERQWIQIEKIKNRDNSYYIDSKNLKREMDSWTYPLHFIDFETTMTAIPFNRGRHPYEGIAFQYSHHIVRKDGTIEHAGQYLNTERGVFPSYDFLRNLKKELSADNGSIFRYSNHENTYLNMIYNQLRSETSKIADKEELLEFIKSITHSTKESTEEWIGKRDMIDLWVLVKRYYYDPATNGSNSIKFVLPAILNSSEFLQKKYSKPIYGAVNGIKSHNYKDWKWIEFKDGKVVDPYKLLPKMFSDVSEKDMETLLSEESEIRDGGAALTAYAKMQFEEMSDYERDEIGKALLKYCELDTMAMVMIYEGWKDLINKRPS